MGYYPRPDGGGYDSYSPGGYSYTDGHHNWAAVERPPEPPPPVTPPVTLSYSAYPDQGDDGRSSSRTGGHSYPWSNKDQFFDLLFTLMVIWVAWNVEFTLEVIFRLIFAWYEYHWVETAVMFAVAIIVTMWAKYQRLRCQDLVVSPVVVVSPLVDATGGDKYRELRCQDLPSGPKLSEARDRAEKMDRISVLLWWAAVLVTVALSVNTAFLTPQPEVDVQKVQKGNREYVRGHLYNPEDVRGGREGPVRTLLWEEIPSPQEGWKLVTEALYGRSSLERSIPTAEVKRLIQELANPENGGAVARLLNFDHSTAVHHSLRARYRLEEIRIDEASHNPNYSWRDNPYHPRHQFGSK